MIPFYFSRYWFWLPRAARMFLVGGILGSLGLVLLYVLPYSDFALYFLAGLDFCAMVMMGMGATYAVFDTLKSFSKKRKNTSDSIKKEVNDEK